MSLSLSDAATGWSFTCLTDSSNTRPQPGGLVLQDMRHQQHNFAKDLRLIGLWLRIERVNPPNTVVSTSSHFLPLSDPPFTVGTVRVLTPAAPTHPTTPGGTFRYLREADEAMQFRTYFRDPSANYVAYGVRADYTLPGSHFSANWPNCEVDALNVSQRFLFSRYANSPPHEPSGVLQAARCHPMIRFELVPNNNVDRTRTFYRVGSIRFDYRLHLYLDRHHELATNAGLPQNGNQAGLFRDEETIDPFGGFGGLFRSGSGTSVSHAIFAAVEKPLVLEVVAPGLNEGLTVLGKRSIYPPVSQPRSWDNVHWWSSRGPNNPMISTPGGFHAAHVHWRWGGVGSITRPGGIPEIDTSGVPTAVQPHPWAGASTRTLVDPGIWIQSIRVAVVRNERTLNPNQSGVQLQNLSQEDWQTLFTRLRATPTDIYNGDDLVLWYSTEVHRETRLPAIFHHSIFPMQVRPAAVYLSRPSGTVFLHGIFFGHNAEIRGFGVGSTGPQHWPKSAASIRSRPEWYRKG